jgi:hypothetical protein
MLFTASMLAIACFLLGQWSAGGKTVRAAAEDNLQFEFRGVDAQGGLLLYYPSQRTIYLYQGVMAGNSALQCTYKFKLNEPGGVVRRQQCDVQRLIP